MSTQDYRIRLVCPHWDFDRWVVLNLPAVSLEEVLNTFWDFACPTHGSLHLKPLQAELKKVFHRPGVN